MRYNYYVVTYLDIQLKGSGFSRIVRVDREQIYYDDGNDSDNDYERMSELRSRKMIQYDTPGKVVYEHGQFINRNHESKYLDTIVSEISRVNTYFWGTKRATHTMEDVDIVIENTYATDV